MTARYRKKAMRESSIITALSEIQDQLDSLRFLILKKHEEDEDDEVEDEEDAKEEEDKEDDIENHRYDKFQNNSNNSNYPHCNHQNQLSYHSNSHVSSQLYGIERTVSSLEISPKETSSVDTEKILSQNRKREETKWIQKTHREQMGLSRGNSNTRNNNRSNSPPRDHSKSFKYSLPEDGRFLKCKHLNYSNRSNHEKWMSQEGEASGKREEKEERNGLESSDLLTLTFAEYLHSIGKHESSTYGGRNSIYTMSTNISRITGMHSNVDQIPRNVSPCRRYFDCRDDTLEIKNSSVHEKKVQESLHSSLSKQILPPHIKNSLGSADYQSAVSSKRESRDERTYFSGGTVPMRNKRMYSSLSSVPSVDSLLGLIIEGEIE